jgi:hypothetical protein
MKDHITVLIVCLTASDVDGKKKECRKGDGEHQVGANTKIYSDGWVKVVAVVLIDGIARRRRPEEKGMGAARRSYILLGK